MKKVVVKKVYHAEGEFYEEVEGPPRKGDIVYDPRGNDWKLLRGEKALFFLHYQREGFTPVLRKVNIKFTVD